MAGYLFFDVECANCFGGVGKMCSFGYVLTDEKFNVVESDDIVMNPECEFDWYLFKNKDDIKLAYPQEHFRSQPNFTAFHERIVDLLSKRGAKVFAFGALNDIGFVISACERYSLPVPAISALDLERVVKSDDEIFGSLEKRCAILGVDNSDLVAHKSSDDAVMTMRLLRAYCSREGVSASDIFRKNGGSVFTTARFLKKREERKRKKERCKQYQRGRRGAPKTGGALDRRRKDSRTISFDY